MSDLRMIEKSVNLHVELIKTEIQVSAVFSAAAGLAMVFTPLLYVLASLLFMISVIICGYKIQNKIFGKSLYGEGSEVYQILPLSPRDVLIGKALAIVVWETSLLAAMLLPMGILFFRPNELIGTNLFPHLMESLAGPGLNPAQMGILAGLSFIGLFIAEFAWCMYMVLAQNLIHRFAGKLAAKVGDFPCILFAGLLLSGTLFGGRQLVGLLALRGTAVFWFIIGKYALLLGTGILLYYFCRENLEKAYGH